ncbi:hypothetical protein HKI87_04g28120 [Chloropicon roscoffensis]|uniref:Uncharacterized protein n=2 Tax=Chloropicon roscoffensis TaxID=1461544 RepID=A0AAX4P5S0_9CHLO
MHSRGSTPTSFIGHTKTFPFAGSGGGLPLYRTNRATVFQSAVKQLKNKYSLKFQKKLLLVVLALLALVILVRSRSWYARSTA